MPHLVKITLRTLILSFYVGVRVVLGLWAAVIAARRLLQEVKTEQHHVPLFLTTWTTAVVVWSHIIPTTAASLPTFPNMFVCLRVLCAVKKKVKVKNGVWWRSKDRRIISNHRGKKRILPVSEISQISQNQIFLLKFKSYTNSDSVSGPHAGATNRK